MCAHFCHLLVAIASLETVASGRPIQDQFAWLARSLGRDRDSWGYAAAGRCPRLPVTLRLTLSSDGLVGARSTDTAQRPTSKIACHSKFQCSVAAPYFPSSQTVPQSLIFCMYISRLDGMSLGSARLEQAAPAARSHSYPILLFLRHPPVDVRFTRTCPPINQADLRPLLNGRTSSLILQVLTTSCM